MRFGSRSQSAAEPILYEGDLIYLLPLGLLPSSQPSRVRPGEPIPYAAALDMAEWAEQHGCLQLVIPGHHGADDGYLITQPLCGGLPPELAWPSLKLIAGEVLPRV